MAYQLQFYAFDKTVLEQGWLTFVPVLLIILFINCFARGIPKQFTIFLEYSNFMEMLCFWNMVFGKFILPGSLAILTQAVQSCNPTFGE